MLKMSLTHSGVWGNNSQDFSKQAQSRKAFHLEVDKSIIIKLMRNAQGEGMILYGFFVTGLMVLVVRPGYRISSRTTKRGSQVSNLIV
jgi:hypothetical protein